MVSKSPIKNTFINSTIFETQEDIQNRPFEFMTDKLQQISPENVPNKLYEGYLLQIQVSHPEFRFGSGSLKLLFEKPATEIAALFLFSLNLVQNYGSCRDSLCALNLSRRRMAKREAIPARPKKMR